MPIEIPTVAPDGVTSLITAADDGSLTETTPVVLLKPAMGVRATFYQPLFDPFSNAGLRLATADLRGHGTSSIRPGWRSDFGYRHMVELDWTCEIDALARRWPEAPLVLLGHSLGGQLNLLYAAANPYAVAAVVTCASCSVYWRSYPRGLAVLIMTQLAALLGKVLGHYPGHRLGFAGKEARGVVADWAHQARTGRYRARGSSTNYESLLAQSPVPSLIVSLDQDDYAPPSAADHLAGKLPQDRCTRLHLNHPISKPAHFRWVNHAPPIVRAIHDWLIGQGIAERRSRPS